MNNFNKALLKSIDSIEETIVESELNVCVELLNGYAKSTMIVEYADESVINEYMIIQESAIGDFFASIGKSIKRFFSKIAMSLGLNIGGMTMGFAIGHKVNKLKRQFDKANRNAKKQLKNLGGTVPDVKGDILGVNATIKGYTDLTADAILSVTGMLGFLGMDKKEDGVVAKLNAVAKQTKESDDPSIINNATGLLNGALNALGIDFKKKDENAEEGADEEVAETADNTTPAASTPTSTPNKSNIDPTVRQSLVEKTAELCQLIIKEINDIGECKANATDKNVDIAKNFNVCNTILVKAFNVVDTMIKYLPEVSENGAGSELNPDVLNAKFAELADSSVKKCKPFTKREDSTGEVLLNIPPLTNIINLVTELSLDKISFKEGISKIQNATNTLRKGNTNLISINSMTDKSGKNSQNVGELLKMGEQKLAEFAQKADQFEQKYLKEGKNEDRNETEKSEFNKATAELSSALTQALTQGINIVNGIQRTKQYFENN